MITFIESAASRETSPELMAAILRVARNDVDAARVWEAPTDAELVAIVEIVTGNGSTPTTDYYWGAAGNQWVQLPEEARS